MIDLTRHLASRSAEMTDLLSSLIAIPSISGAERAMTEFVADYARRQGWQVDLWQSDEDDLRAIAPLPPKFIPLANRPTLAIKIPGTGRGRSLMFNGHADVVAAPNAPRWKFGPWSGALYDGKIFGRGACDIKGPLVSALWAMRALQDARARLAGDVMLELIPGVEDCVGLGTLTSVARGWRSDGVIVLEPTEGMPRCASRGGLRFQIAMLGQSVHGTVKWLGRDAIALLPELLARLLKLESEWNDRAADPLFLPYPLMRPITVDSIQAGDWQGMVCDRCLVSGYVELLPNDDLLAWTDRFKNALRNDNHEIFIIERYDGHATTPTDPLCLATGNTQPWSAFNSGCEAGLRARLLSTPTLVWGPGSLAQAHAIDEFVEMDQVALVARQFAETAIRYCGPTQPATK